MIQDIFLQHRRRYGARRIGKELNERGESCSRAKVRKIMVQRGLIAIQPRSFKPRTTNSGHQLGYSPNLLLEGIELESINQIWVGDITYIPLPNTFAYLAMLMDLFSRKIVGWSLELNMAEPLEHITFACSGTLRA
jgi:putative transposase